MKFDFSNVPLPDAPTGATAPLEPSIEFDSEPWNTATASKRNPDAGALVDLNLDGAKRAIKIFDDQVTDMERQAQALEVKSSESAQNATEMTGQVKRLFKSVDDRRKEIIAEPDSFTRKVNGFCKPLTDRLKNLEILLKRKLSDFAYQVEMQRREIEKAQREAAERLQAEINKSAEAKGIEPVQVAPVSLPTKQGPTRSDTAVASTVMHWRHEVIDPASVPRQYLMVDDRSIRAAVDAGIRDIPGVRIFEEAEIRVRRI